MTKYEILEELLDYEELGVFFNFEHLTDNGHLVVHIQVLVHIPEKDTFKVLIDRTGKDRYELLETVLTKLRTDYRFPQDKPQLLEYNGNFYDQMKEWKRGDEILVEDNNGDWHLVTCLCKSKSSLPDIFSDSDSPNVSTRGFLPGIDGFILGVRTELPDTENN